MKTFTTADILIPKNENMEKWCVVACDQYTSEPSYWSEVESIVGDNPSTLRLTLPEIYLEDDDVSERIKKINETMSNYLDEGIFKTLENSMIYVERTTLDGRVRKGIIGKIDLEDYDYNKGSETMVRATEKTVIERIPPRMKVRENALIELPHIMLLIDDEKKDIIDSLDKVVTKDEMVYDVDLMQKGGHITGYKLKDEDVNDILSKLDALADKNVFEDKYGVSDKGVLLFAVGDGNHSLATAKATYNKLKESNASLDVLNKARYALVEVVNLHSDALEFEPIHRVLFDIDTDDFMRELNKYYDINKTKTGQKIHIITKGIDEDFYIDNPKSNLAVGSIQLFIDEYLGNHKGRVDYIHGDDVTRSLGKKENNIGILLPKMEKNDLFKTVILDGALPRKTFSMGHSYDKRYYLEARKIR